MTFSKTFGLNLQLMLVIIATAVSITVVDNIIDAQRQAENFADRNNTVAPLQEGHELIINQTAENKKLLEQVLNATR